MSNTRKRPSNSIRDRVVDFRRVPASQLIPNPKNWRVHNDAQVQAFQSIVASIGFAGAELVREMPDGRLMLIDGHMRADTLGDMPVPCLVTDLSEHEADALLATFDPIGRLAGTDQDAAAALIESLGVAGYDAAADLLRAVADNDQTSALLESLADGMLGGSGDGESHDVDDPSGGGDDFDTTPNESGPTRVQPGDLWQLGEHRLLCGDSTKREDVARLMDGALVDCVFTSPPYAVGVDYGDTYEDTIANLRSMLPQLSRLWLDVVVDGGFAVVNFGDIAPARNIANTDEPCEYPMALEYWPVFRRDGWLLWSRRIWCKPNARVNSMWCIQSNRGAADWEHVWTWRKHGDAIVKRVDGDMSSARGWFDSSRSEALDIGKDTHGAGMPLIVAARMLAIHSRDDAAILEPFCGTGTTLIAAERLNRQCYALEINPRFADIIIRRYEAETGREATLLERISEPEHATATA